MEIQEASLEDAAAILALQKAAYRSEAEIYNDFKIQPLQQTLDDALRDFSEQTVLKAVQNGVVIGAVRGYMSNGTCYIGKLIVHPAFQNQGLGTRLLRAMEERFAGEARRYELFTGFRSERNLYLYKKLGYRVFEERPLSENFTMIFLEKTNPA